MTGPLNGKSLSAPDTLNNEDSKKSESHTSKGRYEGRGLNLKETAMFTKDQNEQLSQRGT